MAKHDTSSIILETRDAAGTTASNQLRRAGKVPGVVYGHGEATPVAVDVKALADLLHSRDRTHVIDATIGGRKDSVLLRRVATHPVTRKPLNVDFQRVSRDEAITSSVTVIADGVPTGVRDQGGVLDVVTHALDIKGPADSFPDQLTVDVRGLAVHEHLTASQVALPDGFTLLTPPDTIVVSVSLTRAGAGTETDVPAEGAPGEAPTASP